jgi:hypothetical protein
MVIRNSFWEMQTNDLDLVMDRRGRALSDSWLTKAEAASEISTEDERQSWVTLSSDSELLADESSTAPCSEDGGERWADSASDSEEESECVRSRVSTVAGPPGTWAGARPVPVVYVPVQAACQATETEQPSEAKVGSRRRRRGCRGGQKRGLHCKEDRDDAEMESTN